MKNTWITKNRIKIPFSKLGDLHLKNILNLIKTNAKIGVLDQSGGGLITGEAVLEKFKYCEIRNELFRRKRSKNES